MSNLVRIRLVLAAAVLVIAGSVWLAARDERTSVQSAYVKSDRAQSLLVSMLDQETGLRGYVISGRPALLAPFKHGRARFASVMGVAIAASERDGDTGARAALQRQSAIASRWQDLAESEIAMIRDHPGRRVAIVGVLTRKHVMDSFRAANAGYERMLARQRSADLRRGAWLMVALIVGLSLLFGVLGWLFIDRPAVESGRARRADKSYRAGQEEFVEALQVTPNEGEAYHLLKRHLERSAEGSSVVVLNRNNSQDRLEATTPVEAGSKLAAGLEGAAPSSCLAVRLAKPHARDGSDDSLLRCEVCGDMPGRSTCVPSLVGGEVIGSVLLAYEAPLRGLEERRVTESVAQAAPVLANLRNLALAETRAATDALTGLPNHRAVEESMMRMVAQSGRTLSPLSVVLFDLDHFKTINDTFGHDRGDEVLAAVGDAVAASVRASDFVGRYGGEEFVMLLPDTAADGAVKVAEKLRAALASVTVPGVDRRVTASFGIALCPGDAADPESLRRRADRALYTAKSRGRNRIELASDQADVRPDALMPTSSAPQPLG